MSLRRVARNWNAFARVDPLWSILTWDEKRGHRWGREEFFATGRDEVDAVLLRAGALAPDLGRGRALDFGCGVGRLSLALRAHFDEVHGVDIATAMVDAARQFDPEERVTYHVNAEPCLGLFPDRHFDFVYSSITLQHLAPRWIDGYLREFARILVPGGVAVFQLPSAPRRRANPNPIVHRIGVLGSRALRRVRNAWSRAPVMDMHGRPRAVVAEVLSAAGCDLLAVDPSTMAGLDWESFLYVAQSRVR